MAAHAMRFMSPDDYRRRSGTVVPLRSAERPAPTNVTDGRFWGDEVFAELFTPTSVSTADQAAKGSAVYFCVSLIAEAVGNCPIEFTDQDNVKVTEFGLADVLAYAPNPMQTGAEFWPSMLFCAALTGHAFAEPVVDGDAMYLWPLHPNDYTVDWRRRGFTLAYSEEGRVGTRTFNAGQLFWFSGLANACLQPLAPWKMAKGAIDFALALENQGRKFFQKGARLGGVVESDKPIDPDNHTKLQTGIDRWRTGGIPLLEDGLKFKELGAKNTDSQFVELIDLYTHQMARYWRIPRSFYGEVGNAKSQEQESQGFVKWTARPVARRLEQAIAARLMTPDQRRLVKPRVNLDALLRGDSMTQWRNAVLARTASILSVNEIRVDWFGKARIDEPWADDPRSPLNSNRAADTDTGGETSPQDKVE